MGEELGDVEIAAICISCSQRFGVPMPFDVNFKDQVDGRWICPRCDRGTTYIYDLGDMDLNELAYLNGDDQSQEEPSSEMIKEMLDKNLLFFTREVEAYA